MRYLLIGLLLSGCTVNVADKRLDAEKMVQVVNSHTESIKALAQAVQKHDEDIKKLGEAKK